MGGSRGNRSLIDPFSLGWGLYTGGEKSRRRTAPGRSRSGGQSCSEGAKDTVAELLENMIEISDNESYNELVRLQSSNRNFGEGCGFINAYLQEEGYTGSGVHTTLHPAVSSTANDGLGDNVTCVEDSENFWKRFTKETAVPRKIPEKCSIFF